MPLQNLLLLCLFAFKAVSSLITQSPGKVVVPLGETAKLRCDVQYLLASCSKISWYKLHPRTQKLKVSTAVISEPEKNGPCLGVIHNTALSDSGIYYCAAVHTIMSYMGNGSRLIITEPSPQPVVSLYISDESDGSGASMQCVVMGVVPSEVRVSWVVKQTVLSGWTESGWTNDSDSAVEFTRAHITLPSNSRRDDVECVVELDGRTFSKSLRKGSSSFCTWFVYLGFGVAFLIVFVTVIVMVSSYSARGGNMTERLDGSESHVRRLKGKWRKQAVEDSCLTEVQYASLDMVRIGPHSSNLIQT